MKLVYTTRYGNRDATFAAPTHEFHTKSFRPNNSETNNTSPTSFLRQGTQKEIRMQIDLRRHLWLITFAALLMGSKVVFADQTKKDRTFNFTGFCVWMPPTILHG